MIMILSSTSFQVPHVKDELNNLIKKGWYIKILLKRKIPLKVYIDKGEYINANEFYDNYITYIPKKWDAKTKNMVTKDIKRYCEFYGLDYEEITSNGVKKFIIKNRVI